MFEIKNIQDCNIKKKKIISENSEIAVLNKLKLSCFKI